MTNPTPKPRPVPRPSAAPRPRATTPQAPVIGSGLDHEAALAEAKTFGRADADGTVHLVTAEGERAVGQYPDTTPEAAVEYFARKYVELAESAALLRARLAAGANGADIRKSARALQQTVAGADVVGDLPALSAQLDTLLVAAEEAVGEQSKAAAAARAEAVAEREQIVQRAEEIAAADPARVQWKQSGQQMQELFERWKTLQRSGAKIPRAEDQALWGRFSKARNTFDKHRREFFSQLDKRNAEGKRLKEKLVAEAEALSTSTDWKGTAARYRELMDRWKATPRAGRKDDDALWARFRGAQDVFFHARQQENEAIDASYAENLVVKEQLLTEARALLPVTDIESTKRRLRDIQDRWEEAGRVPRADVSRMEKGLREVEQALAAAETEEWERTNPETRARTSRALAQLDESIAELQAELDAAESGGDEKRITAAREALTARQAWRDTLARTAAEFS